MPRETDRFKVVINHEEQYALWPARQAAPLGWNDAGKTGTREQCLDHIEEVWTDMRPLSLRRKVEENTRALEGKAGRR
jgi:MbtH protein